MFTCVCCAYTTVLPLRSGRTAISTMLIPNTAMAVPVVKTVQDCADWSKTVEPYIPQLYALPAQIASSITSTTSLAQLYASTNPVISAFAFSCALFPVFLLVSEINKNYSQVDRVWSILPTVYNIHYAVWATINGLPTAKVYSVMVFSVIWSVRLTFNYWRRGGYQIGSEDYRWALIKEKIGQPWFFLLNVLFVSSLQSVSESIRGKLRGTSLTRIGRYCSWPRPHPPM